MRKLFLILHCCAIACLLKAQPVTDIISGLKIINNAVTNTPCGKGRGMLISNRAMNLFLADKAGSYLSESNDLSYFKNYITLNTATGVLSLNHSLFKSTGIDEAVKSFTTIGVKANAANSFAAAFGNKSFNNEIGFTIKHTWIGKTSTYFDKCPPTGVSSAPNQKQQMDAARAAILHSLEAEILKKEADFETSLQAIVSTDVPGQSLDSVKAHLRATHFVTLKEEYETKFAQMQADVFESNTSYNLVATHFTSVDVYIPLLSQRFVVAPSFSGNFENKHAYPWQLTVSHTRLWESVTAGRIFFTLGGQVFMNNSKQSRLLTTTNLTDYKSLGGTDTLHLAQLTTQDAFIGSYKQFITPVLRARLVCLPPNWHFGLSVMAEQNMGTYNAFNGYAGIPIVLIDKNGKSSFNVEFQVRFFDISNTIMPTKSFGDKTSVGINIGVPFSSLIY